MKIFMNIEKYSKERKIDLINKIEKINWDTNYNPEEFLDLLNTDQMREWALTRIISFMHYKTVRRLLTRDFLKKYISQKMLSSIFPKEKQEIIKSIYGRL